MNATKIEWVKNPDGTQGYTWNPITGCLNHTPEGLCLGGMFPCYAYKLANGRLRHKYLWNDNFAPVIEASKSLGGKPVSLPMLNPFYPRFWEERLDDPFLVDRNILIKRHTRGQRGIPRGIFVCDMGELFGDWLPREWQEEIHLTIILNPQHRFYLLTKQPQNLAKWSPFPDHCYVGVTATNRLAYLHATSDKGLDGIEAKVKYISFEPLLEQIGASDYRLSAVNWLIIGAQTKPYKPPKIEWVEEIEFAARQANIPIFEKDNLKPLLLRELIQEIPE